MATNTEMQVRVNIPVFVGEPLDYQRYRHTALRFQFSDSTTAPVVIHITGPNRGYKLEARDDFDESMTFAKDVLVGWLRVPMTKAQLVSFVCQTPIDNSDLEFNCQTWVERALKRLVQAGYLEQEDYTNGVNGMVDATMEATEEEP